MVCSVRRAAFIAVAFLVVAFAGDRLLSLCCDRLLALSEFRFSRALAVGRDADILIFGDSRAVNTFYAPGIEDACGLRALNLGYNGCSTELAALFFEDYLERHPPPALVIVEVSSASQGNELLKSLKMYSGTSTRIADALTAYAPAISTACGLTHLYRFNSEMFLRALFYLGRDDQMWINSYTIGAPLLAAVRAQADEPLQLAPPRSENMNALARMRIHCEARGIPMALVLGPYLPAYRQRLTGLADWLATIEAAADESVSDWSLSVSQDDCFADTLHLNSRGANILMPQVKQLLTDKLRGDTLVE